MFTEGLNLALAIYSGAIGWVSMAFFGINNRFKDQYSPLGFVFNRFISAIGGIVGGWVFTQLPLEDSLWSLTIASFLGAFIFSDMYTILSGRMLSGGPWTPGPWGSGGPWMPTDFDVFLNRPRPFEGPIDTERPSQPVDTERPGQPMDRE